MSATPQTTPARAARRRVCARSQSRCDVAPACRMPSRSDMFMPRPMAACLRNNTGGIPALRQQETLMLTAKALANTFDAMVPLLGD